MDWLLRFVKGIFIGSGFILPGVSGGALAAVFGLYERLIHFLAHLREDFLANLRFFLPVGLGGLAGVFGLSFAVSFFLGNYEALVLWFFIGCILGTLPALWRQAGKKGRSARDPWLSVLAGVVSLAFLLFGERLLSGGVTPSFATWMLAGALIALGMIVPGLSPSNFLVYMGMYKALTDGISALDWAVLLPTALGGGLCLLALAKVMDWAFARWHAPLFHLILGVVVASTVMIVPRDAAYLSWASVGFALACLAGVALGWWMSALETRYDVA